MRNEYELPTLSANPDVRPITVIDAATGEVLHVYRARWPQARAGGSGR